MTPSEPAATEVEATPRTDAFSGALYNESCRAAYEGHLDESPEQSYSRAIDFARTLERESARLRAAFSELATEMEFIADEGATERTLRGWVQQLRAALKETP